MAHVAGQGAAGPWRWGGPRGRCRGGGWARWVEENGGAGGAQVAARAVADCQVAAAGWQRQIRGREMAGCMENKEGGRWRLGGCPKWTRG